MLSSIHMLLSSANVIKYFLKYILQTIILWWYYLFLNSTQLFDQESTHNILLRFMSNVCGQECLSDEKILMSKSKTGTHETTWAKEVVPKLFLRASPSASFPNLGKLVDVWEVKINLHILRRGKVSLRRNVARSNEGRGCRGIHQLMPDCRPKQPLSCHTLAISMRCHTM